MSAIKDDRGFNQIYEQSGANLISLRRRADWMINEMNATPDKKSFRNWLWYWLRISIISLKKTGCRLLALIYANPFIKEAIKKYILPNLYVCT